MSDHPSYRSFEKVMVRMLLGVPPIPVAREPESHQTATPGSLPSPERLEALLKIARAL